MKDISKVETLPIPSDVTVKIKARKITVEGPRGVLHKDVRHVAMDINVVSIGGDGTTGGAAGRQAWQGEDRGEDEEEERVEERVLASENRGRAEEGSDGLVVRRG